MAQIINLLNSIPKEQIDNSLLSPPKTNKIMIMMTMVFVCIFIQTVYVRIATGIHFNGIERDATYAKKTYEELTAKYPEATQEVLALRSKEIQQHISVKQSMLDLLKNETLSTKGFTPFLQAFSESIIPGVWITMIDIDISHKYVGIKGNGLSGPLILKFVDKLSKSKEFLSMKMGFFKMEKESPESVDMMFQISNQVERPPGSPHDSY